MAFQYNFVLIGPFFLTGCQILDDSSVYHEGKTGSIRASSEPKISSVGQEMAELWLIYQPKVGLLKIVSCQI